MVIALRLCMECLSKLPTIAIEVCGYDTVAEQRKSTGVPNVTSESTACSGVRVRYGRSIL